LREIDAGRRNYSRRTAAFAVVDEARHAKAVVGVAAFLVRGRAIRRIPGIDELNTLIGHIRFDERGVE
jgi:hypothetical protein